MGDRILKRWRRRRPIPFGERIFAFLLGRIVPYTGTMKARVVRLEPGSSRVELPDRRRVRNHLDSIHAVALANLGELATGLAVTTALPAGVRGIPVRISVEYRKKARGRLVAECTTEVPEMLETQKVSETPETPRVERRTDPVEHRVSTSITDGSGDVVAVFEAVWMLASAGKRHRGGESRRGGGGRGAGGGRGRARSLGAVLAGAVFAGVVACSSGGDGVTDPGSDGPGDDPGPGGTEVEARTYAMGWAPGAPRADEALLLQTIDSMAVVSDLAIIQQPVPWPQLLAGASLDSLVEDRGSLADYLHLGKGLDIVFLVDPLDGLNRTREDPGLVEEGRSILEPEIRALHEEWVREVADRIEPEYFGLASEINTLADRGDPELYEEIRDLVITLAPQVRQRSPETEVFVSFQIDEANGALPGVELSIDHFELIGDFEDHVDALGLSSYPGFAFDHPSEIPDDYIQVFDQATDLPLLMVEGGWGSEPGQFSSGSPAQQVAYFERYEELLDEVEARAWIGLTFTDLDVESFDLPEERAQGLSNFAYMGIMDVDLQRKSSYEVWAEIFERPLE